MMGRRDHRRSGWALALLASVFSGVLAMPARAEADRPGGPSPRELARAGARVAWGTPLPLKFTTSIRSARLVNEYLYAIGTDDQVWAVRADTGERGWTRRLGDPVKTLWPPVAASTDFDAVAFTRVDDVVFVDPATGLEVERERQDESGKTQAYTVGPVQLRSVSLASAAASQEHVFTISPGRRVRAYDVVDSYESWQAEMPGLLRLAPIYLPRRELLLVADASGLVAGLQGKDGKTKFACQVEGEPIGWLAADPEAAYVATSRARLYTLKLEAGEVDEASTRTSTRTLSSQPTGGPVVTETSVYQATEDGIQRVAKEADGGDWVAPGTKAFLAEWPGQVVLLGSDGKVVFAERASGKVVATVDPGGPFTGVSNTLNDAAILVSSRGKVVCLRPVGAPNLTVAAFRPPPMPASASPEAEHEVAEGEEGARTEGSAETAPAEEEAAKPAGPRMTVEDRLLADPLRSSTR